MSNFEDRKSRGRPMGVGVGPLVFFVVGKRLLAIFLLHKNRTLEKTPDPRSNGVEQPSQTTLVRMIFQEWDALSSLLVILHPPTSLLNKPV